MIAEVYPIQKMPRKARVFDYVVPDSLSLERGMLIKIPFRNKELFGIVAKVKDKPLRGIRMKPVSTIYKNIKLREEELSFFEHLSKDFAQSVPSVLHHAIPTPYKRESTSVENKIFGGSLTIPSSEVIQISRIVKNLLDTNKAFVFSPDIKRTAAAIASYIREKENQKCVILAPNILDAKLLAKYLHGFNPILVTSEESQGKRFHAFETFHGQSEGLLIGTKPALFFIDGTVTTIFVVKSTHHNHGQHERNPRFDVREIAKKYSDSFSTNLFFFDAGPRVDDLETFSKTNIIGEPTALPAEIIRMELERRHAPHPVFSLATLQTIEGCISGNQPVLCVFNKKGTAQRLKCNDCEASIKCSKCSNAVAVHKLSTHCVRCSNSEPIPLSCPECKSKKLFELGYGNDAIEAALNKLFPNVNVSKMDKEHPEFDLKAHIYLSTSYFLENHFNPFKPKKFGAVILLDADSLLYRQSFRALEETLYETDSWRSVAHANRCRFLVQTNSPALFHEYFSDPIQMYQNELETRRSYNQPPFSRWATITFTEKESRKADVEINVLIQGIQRAAPDVKHRTKQVEEKNEYTLELSTRREDFQPLLDFFVTLPDHYIIDTNAFS